MKNIKMAKTLLTFKAGCNLYLDNCRQRNLREGTINHYKQSYIQFYKYFDMEMLLIDFDKSKYEDYVLYLRKTIENDVSINSYLRDLITTAHFWMNEEYIDYFKMQAILITFDFLISIFITSFQVFNINMKDKAPKMNIVPY